MVQKLALIIYFSFFSMLLSQLGRITVFLVRIFLQIKYQQQIMNQNQYYYQSVPNHIQNSIPPQNPTSINNQQLRNQQNIQAGIVKKSNTQFFNTLQHYKPLCYSGKGSPIFVLNRSWYFSLGCLLVIDALFILTIVLFLRSANTGIKPMSQQSIRKYKIVNICLVAAINIAYFFTQFLNPGICNLSNITQQQYEKDGKIFCAYCNGYRTQSMQHCKDCEVCIWGLDHHCGFFSKCIGGLQKYAFYAFLCVTFLGFFSLIVTMTANTGL